MIFIKTCYFDILFNLYLVCLGLLPKKISDVGHKVIDKKEDSAHRESNAVEGVINDIEDQIGESDQNRSVVLENCIAWKCDKDCADGSDEDPDNCGKSLTI